METAVRVHLGFARAGVLEGSSATMVAGIRDVASGRKAARPRADLSRKLLLGLLGAPPT